MFIDSAWRNVKAGWGDGEANVTCNLLGYNTGSAYFDSVGGGSSSLMPTSLSCSGSEASLFDCQGDLSLVLQVHFPRFSFPMQITPVLEQVFVLFRLMFSLRSLV
jgi:hypothetical protein